MVGQERQMQSGGFLWLIPEEFREQRAKISGFRASRKQLEERFSLEIVSSAALLAFQGLSASWRSRPNAA